MRFGQSPAFVIRLFGQFTRFKWSPRQTVVLSPHVALATLTTRWEEAARPLCFAIGGAEGLDEAVTKRADHRLSLGPLTWPHLLVRALLAEQLFRAQCIRANHPYHRAWRPA